MYIIQKIVYFCANFQTKYYKIMSEQENAVSFFRFEDLRIYAKALEYTRWLYEKTSHFSGTQETVLAGGLLKSAQAIVLNIAEGSARNKAQFIYYLKMAKSSLRECVVYTELAARLGSFSEDDKEYSRNQLMELTRMIGSLVSSLQRAANMTSSRNDDDMDMMSDL